MPSLLAQVAIYKAAQVTPTVLIPGGNRTVQQSWEVSLQGSASYPSALVFDQSSGACTRVNRSGRALDFAWSADPTGPTFLFEALPPQYAATQTSAQLVIPANFLKVTEKVHWGGKRIYVLESSRVAAMEHLEDPFQRCSFSSLSAEEKSLR